MLYLLVAIVLAVVVVLVMAMQKPDRFAVRRSILIDAPAQKIYGLLDDFHQWPAWSPWEHRDPAMKRELGAITKGPGATYAWEGNREVGQGRMEITASEVPARLEIKLDFLKPFEAHNQVVFNLQPQGPATEVAWEMHGPANFMTKLMQVFMSMDRMVGRDFEAGLSKLKAVAQQPSAGT